MADASTTASPAAAAPAPTPATAPAAAPTPGLTGSLDQRDKFKLVVVGDEAVGKTSLITRFMYDSFETTYNITIGIDFASKNVYLDDRVVRLQLWDTAGQERFRSLIPLYTRDSAAAILVFDLTSRASFNSVQRWADDTRRERGDGVLIVLVGNKTDVADPPAGEGKRMVTTAEALALASRLQVDYFETSAKTGDEVKALFQHVAEALVARPPPQGPHEAAVGVVDVTAGGGAGETEGGQGGMCGAC